MGEIGGSGEIVGIVIAYQSINSVNNLRMDNKLLFYCHVISRTTTNRAGRERALSRPTLAPLHFAADEVSRQLVSEEANAKG